MWKEEEGNFDFDLDHRDVEFFFFVDDVSLTCLCQMFCCEGVGDAPEDDESDTNVGQ